jgi:hypothetical protein
LTKNNVRRVDKGECTPFLGAEVCYGMLSFGGKIAGDQQERRHMICGRKQIQRLSALLVMMLVTGVAAVAAQAVDGDPIQLMDTQFGRLSTDTPDMMYSVEVYAEQVFSVRAWPISGDLQLEVTVSDPAGDVVAESVLAYEKGGTVVAEAILAPTDGMYSILVQRVGETSGDFGVVALPGFGELSIQDRFDNDGLFQLFERSIMLFRAIS